MGQISLNPINKIFSNGLNKPQIESDVYMLMQRNANTFGFIAELARQKAGIASATKVANGTDRKAISFFGKFQKAVLFDATRSATSGVTPTVLSGNLLKVTWTDPTLDIFRKTDVLTDGTSADNQGRVISHGSGWVVLEPVDDSITMANTMFASNTSVTAYTQASGIGDSTGIESVYQFPDLIDYQTGVQRDNQEIRAYMDTGDTWVKNGVVKGIGNKPYQDGMPWYTTFERDMYNRYYKAKDLRAFQEKMGTFSNSTLPGGTVNYVKGWVDAIKDPVCGG